MNITDFVKANAANRFLSANTGVAAVGGLDAVSQGLQKADKRLQAQVDTTSAQLSSLGKLKSAVSDVQINAHALANLSSAAKTADVEKALKNFIGAFNGAVGTADTLAGTSGQPSVNSGSGRVSKDLQRAVGSDNGVVDALKKAGVSMQADGKLVLDTTKFSASQLSDGAGARAALTKLGERVDKATTQELAIGGVIGGSLATLGQRSSVLKSQQAALASLQPGSTQSGFGSGSNSFGYAISAYQFGNGV